MWSFSGRAFVVLLVENYSVSSYFQRMSPIKVGVKFDQSTVSFCQAERESQSFGKPFSVVKGTHHLQQQKTSFA